MEPISNRNLIEDDRGASLVTVIIIATFVMVLATILIYLSSMNFQMKQTQQRNNQSLYQAENALDKIRELLLIDVSFACQEAYNQVMPIYVTVNADTRKANYEKYFVKNMSKIWIERMEQLSAKDNQETIIAMLSDNSISNTITIMSVGDWEYDEAIGEAVLKGVHIRFSKDGFTTYLTTDYVIKAPEIDWSIESFMPWTNVPETLEDNYLEIADYVLYDNWKKY